MSQNDIKNNEQNYISIKGKTNVLVDDNNKMWYNTKDILKLLNYSEKSDIVIKKVAYENRCFYKNIKKKNKLPNKGIYDIYIDETGLKDLCFNNSDKPKKNIKEITIITDLRESFSHEKIELEYKINDFIIDLYFSEYKLAVKNNNKNDLDITQQNTIIEKLGCTWIIYNSDDINFNIFNVISTINVNIKAIQFTNKRNIKISDYKDLMIKLETENKDLKSEIIKKDKQIIILNEQLKKIKIEKKKQWDKVLKIVKLPIIKGEEKVEIDIKALINLLNEKK